MPQAAAAPPEFAAESLLGATIDGRYRIVAHLATGGMGAVFRAEHVYMRAPLALKLLRPDLTTSPEIVERFRREAEIAASLQHENIVRVTDFGRSPEGYLFLAMEMLEGESLFERLRRLGALAPAEAVGILVQVCRALEAAHRRGVIHRDLKPENIFLDRQRDGRTVVKVLDFGIAKIADPTSRSATQSGMVVGTPEYLSPEQAVGAAVDPRADLYAVGLIAWRMLAGRHPFPTDDPRALLMMQATQPVPSLASVRPDLAGHPALVGVVARACAKGAGERHRSAADLRSELEACLGPAAGAAPPPAPSPTPELESLTPPTRSSLGRGLGMRAARLRALARSGARALAALPRSLRDRAREVADLARLHPRAVAAVAGAALAAAAALGTWHYLASRPAARARDLLARGRPEAALPLLERAVALRPGDPRLLALQGRALHQAGQRSAALDVWEAALQRDRQCLDPQALAELAGDLSRDRRTADRAAHLLVRAGPGAAPAVLEAASQGPGFARLRALEVARDLGAEERIDRVAAYEALLSDPQCEVRRAAARRLGEIGSPGAVRRLRELAQARQETRGFLGITRSEPACGAPEAAAAIRRIQADPDRRP